MSNPIYWNIGKFTSLMIPIITLNFMTIGKLMGFSFLSQRMEQAMEEFLRGLEPKGYTLITQLIRKSLSILADSYFKYIHGFFRAHSQYIGMYYK